MGFVRDLLNTLSYESRLDDLAPVDVPALSKLDQRLAGFIQSGAGERSAILIRPADCAVWDGNPRDQPGLTAETCRSLIESIATEGGNRIPVLVRQKPPGATPPYELLAGSRRRFAIDWLNYNGRPELRLSALIVDLSDEEAFRLADIENREREDITELDRARSYQQALDRFYDGVQSRMAEVLNLSNSQLSRLLALAQMPEEVVDAFATKEEIRVRHSEVLTPLLRRAETRDALIAAARQIGREQHLLAAADERMLGAATVLARLRDAALAQGGGGGRDIPIMVGGEQIGRIRPHRSTGVQVDLAVADGTDIDTMLNVLRQAILATRTHDQDDD